MYKIYKIINTINGKGYIGFTGRTIEQRWKNHISAAKQNNQCRFHHALRKYGPDPWKKELLYEHENLDIVRKVEEEYILTHNYLNSKFGYNAKPGGCGGWIVPEEKYDQWRLRISKRTMGLKNPNSIDISNEELISIGIKVCNKLQRIPGQKTMINEFKILNKKFPKSFQKYRFNGSYQNFIKELQKYVEWKYDRFFRSKEQKEKISKTLKDRKSVKN